MSSLLPVRVGCFCSRLISNLRDKKFQTRLRMILKKTANDVNLLTGDRSGGCPDQNRRNRHENAAQSRKHGQPDGNSCTFGGKNPLEVHLPWHATESLEKLSFRTKFLLTFQNLNQKQSKIDPNSGKLLIDASFPQMPSFVDAGHVLVRQNERDAQPLKSNIVNCYIIIA